MNGCLAVFHSPFTGIPLRRGIPSFSTIKEMIIMKAVVFVKSLALKFFRKFLLCAKKLMFTQKLFL